MFLPSLWLSVHSHMYRKIHATETIPDLLCQEIPRLRTSVLETRGLFQHNQGCSPRVPWTWISILYAWSWNWRSAQSYTRTDCGITEQAHHTDRTRRLTRIISEWRSYYRFRRTTRGFCTIWLAIGSRWIHSEWCQVCGNQECRNSCYCCEAISEFGSGCTSTMGTSFCKVACA